PDPAAGTRARSPRGCPAGSAVGAGVLGGDGEVAGAGPLEEAEEGASRAVASDVAGEPPQPVSTTRRADPTTSVGRRDHTGRGREGMAGGYRAVLPPTDR